MYLRHHVFADGIIYFHFRQLETDYKQFSNDSRHMAMAAASGPRTPILTYGVYNLETFGSSRHRLFVCQCSRRMLEKYL